MNWFGEPWPSAELRAAVCEDDAEQVQPPLPGELCPMCGKEFEPKARGVLIPHISTQGTYGRYHHLECLLGSITPQ